jgi:hypothetical protein
MALGAALADGDHVKVIACRCRAAPVPVPMKAK